MLFMTPRKSKSKKSKASELKGEQPKLEEPEAEEQPSKPREVKQILKKCKVCGDMMNIAAGTKKCPTCGGKLYPVEGAANA